MKVVAIIQCRLGSARLPQKSIKDLCGRPLIRHVVDRALQVKGVDQVVVATPNQNDAMLIGDALRTLDHVPVVWYPRIAQNDVLSRYALAATEFRADVVLRVTGDCPMLDPAISSEVLRRFLHTGGLGYDSNVEDGYVDGTDTEVLSIGALMIAQREVTDPGDREHVTAWTRRWCGLPTVTPSAKTSVDTLEDFHRVEYLLSEYSI